jgi:NADH dehydrogenase
VGTERLVLVTGAAGGVGSALVSELRQRGARVRALVHRREVAGADEIVRGDLTEPESLAPAIADVDAVVHLAAVTHARRARAYELVNVDGTRALVEASRAGGIPGFVHVSTRAASADGGAYARSKLEAEEIVKEVVPSAAVVRLPEVLTGAGREGIDSLFAAAARGVPMRVVGSGDDVVCPITLADAATALVGAVFADGVAGETFTLAGECVSVREFAVACRRHFGTKSRIVGVPVSVVHAAQLAARVLPLPLYPDQLARLRAPKPEPSQHLNERLGFRTRPLRETLALAEPVPVDVAPTGTP